MCSGLFVISRARDVVLEHCSRVLCVMQSPVVTLADYFRFAVKIQRNEDRRSRRTSEWRTTQVLLGPTIWDTSATEQRKVMEVEPQHYWKHPPSLLTLMTENDGTPAPPSNEANTTNNMLTKPISLAPSFPCNVSEHRCIHHRFATRVHWKEIWVLAESYPVRDASQCKCASFTM